AKFFGIKYVDDRVWKTNRVETKIYMEGLFAKMFTMFTGMKIVTSDATRKELMKLQGESAKEITMDRYFDEIDGKTLTLNEFEDFLSKVLLIETNRVFNILDKDREDYFLTQLTTLRHVINGLTGGTNKSIKTMITNFGTVKEIVKILKSVSEAQRLLLFVPHLSLIDSFSKMLTNKKRDMSTFHPHDFFEQTSKFFVLVCNGELTFVERHEDTSNSGTNRTFGPRGFQCPGNIYVIKFIKSILSFLQTFDIKVEGDAIISNKRFKNITNKNDIKITFKKSERLYVNDNSDINDNKEMDEVSTSNE
ncbi:MAG: hypothetical protein Edafosvirus4_1, partial [Edafosvirus sp.]